MSATDTLKAAMQACADGKMGERELIAIALAVNEAIPTTMHPEHARAYRTAFAWFAKRQLLARVAELDEIHQ